MKKKLGVGTLSPFLSIFAAATLTVNVVRLNLKLGDYLLELVGPPIWFDTAYLILFVLAIYLGRKFKDHFFAESGRILAWIFLIFYGMIVVFTILQRMIQIFL